MLIRRNTALILLLLSGLLSLLILPGCTRHRDANENQVQMGQGSLGGGTSARTDQVPPMVSQVPPGPHFVVQSGQDYYVDSRGALHQIVRRETVSGGVLYYYIEGDERGYLVDESGRLYYREPAGRIVYYETLSPSATETVVAPSQPVYLPAPAMSAESCESQYQECMSGCRGISPRQTYDRPNCMSNCDVIRSGCLRR